LKGFIEKSLKRRAYERTHVPVQKRLRRAHRSVTELHHWLKENGRLVLSSNGKQVDVLASEALIRDTADPSKAAVAARHQQERLSAWRVQPRLSAIRADSHGCAAAR
jgi:hypothetical protein